jgi:hypothetical protein
MTRTPESRTFAVSRFYICLSFHLVACRGDTRMLVCQSSHHGDEVDESMRLVALRSLPLPLSPSLLPPPLLSSPVPLPSPMSVI